MVAMPCIAALIVAGSAPISASLPPSVAFAFSVIERERKLPSGFASPMLLTVSKSMPMSKFICCPPPTTDELAFSVACIRCPLLAFGVKRSTRSPVPALIITVFSGEPGGGNAVIGGTLGPLLPHAVSDTKNAGIMCRLSMGRMGPLSHTRRVSTSPAKLSAAHDAAPAHVHARSPRGATKCASVSTTVPSTAGAIDRDSSRAIRL